MNSTPRVEWRALFVWARWTLMRHTCPTAARCFREKRRHIKSVRGRGRKRSESAFRARSAPWARTKKILGAAACASDLQGDCDPSGVVPHHLHRPRHRSSVQGVRPRSRRCVCWWSIGTPSLFWRWCSVRQQCICGRELFAGEGHWLKYCKKPATCSA